MSTAAARHLAAIKDVCEGGDWLVEADWDYFESVRPTVKVRRIRGWWALDIAVTIERGGETVAFAETTKTGTDWHPKDIAGAADAAITEILEADRKYGEPNVENLKLIRMQRWVEVLTGQAFRGGGR